MKKLLFCFAAFALLTMMAACEKTPEYIPVDSVKIYPYNIFGAEIGRAIQLIVDISPKNATDQAVTWRSSNPSVVTVSDTGLITMIAPGEATITATVDGVSDSTPVTVKPLTIYPDGLTLDQTELALEQGECALLTATITPDNATDRDINWKSSDPEVATVDNSGLVTAVNPGNAVITACSHGCEASCTVTVALSGPVPGSVLSLTLTETAITLVKGKSHTLEVNVVPYSANITWSSSNNSIAKVDYNGRVSAIEVGEATITAKSGDKSATCKVTVTSNTISVESLSWGQKQSTMTPGQTFTFTVTINPSNAADQNVTWTSSNTSVAIIEQSNGTTANVKAIAGGTTTIKATCGGKSVSLQVQVTTGVSSVFIKNNKDTWMEGNLLNLTEGEDYQLTGEITAVDAVDKTILWESSNTSYVKVSTTGKVTAIKPFISGSTVSYVTVTAISKTDPSKQYYIYVYVYSNPTGIEVVSPQNPEFKSGVSKNLAFKVLPATARQKVNVTSTSSVTPRWQVEMAGDLTCKFQAPSAISDYSVFNKKYSFRVTTVGSTSVQASKTLEYYVDMWSADDVKPMDYVYYNASTDKFRTSDGGLRFLDPSGNCRMAGSLPAPSPTSQEKCVAMITYVGDFSGNVDNLNNFVGLTNKSGVHGYAVALHDATLSGATTFKWSDDKDDVDASENWMGNVPSWSGDDNIVTHISTGKEEWRNAFKLTYYAAIYNKKRGNSHDIKPLKALMEYGTKYPVGKFTTGSVEDLDGWNTRWVLPTYGMANLGAPNVITNGVICSFNYPNNDVRALFNARISKAGGEAVADRSLWTINTYSNKSAFVLGFSTYGYTDKNNKNPLRCWLVF